MTNPYSGIEKAVAKVASEVKAAARVPARTGGDAPRRERFDVRLLTSEEVGEIRLLIEHERDVGAFSSARMAKAPALEGMHRELADLGLVSIASGGAVVAVHAMARWAVEKRDQSERDRIAAQRRAWNHDFAVAGFGALCGGVLGIAGTLLGVWLGSVI